MIQSMIQRELVKAEMRLGNISGDFTYVLYLICIKEMDRKSLLPKHISEKLEENY